eukprot:Nk52_evm26s1073 gene=Nk52_evmTU26s1073
MKKRQEKLIIEEYKGLGRARGFDEIPNEALQKAFAEVGTRVEGIENQMLDMKKDISSVKAGVDHMREDFKRLEDFLIANIGRLNRSERRHGAGVRSSQASEPSVPNDVIPTHR